MSSEGASSCRLGASSLEKPEWLHVGLALLLIVTTIPFTEGMNFERHICHWLKRLRGKKLVLLMDAALALMEHIGHLLTI